MFKFRIDKEAIKELNDILRKNNLTEIEIKNGNRSIRLSRTPASISIPDNLNTALEQPQDNKKIKRDQEKQTYSKKNCIKAPMLGTLYHASSPKAKPFIKEGSKIKVGDIIFIIEAILRLYILNAK